MLISKDKIKMILEIVKKRHNLFAIKTIGAEVLTPEEIKALQAEYGIEEVRQLEDFLKDAYYAGYLRNKDLGTLVPISHQQFKNDPAKRPLEEFESYTLENSKAITESYVRKLSQEAQTNFNQLIQSYNKTYKDFLQTNLGQGIIDVALPMATIALEENKAVGMLARAMRDQVQDLARNWKRVAITETTNIVNNAMVDKIVKMNGEKSSNEIFVYKRIVNDSAVCKYCLKLHVSSDGTPKIYRLSDVLANGNNIGRKANDWQMVTGAVHPHCFDKETEVLSDRGWVLFKDLAGCEKILSFNFEDEHTYWTDIKAKVSWHHKGVLSHYINDYCDLMVTDRHSHVVLTDFDYEFVTDDELNFYTDSLIVVQNPNVNIDEYEYNLEPLNMDSVRMNHVDYDDMVYDVELVKDHTLFVRRNGKVILSGNCRCQLSQLPTGWYFSKEGPLEFIGEKNAQERIDENLGEE